MNRTIDVLKIRKGKYSKIFLESVKAMINTIMNTLNNEGSVIDEDEAFITIRVPSDQDDPDDQDDPNDQDDLDDQDNQDDPDDQDNQDDPDDQANQTKKSKNKKKGKNGKKRRN